MSNPTKLVINCATGTREEIPLTQVEIDEREAMALQAEADRVEKEEADAALVQLKNSARSKLVAGEPLTEEEAATIVF